VTIEIELTSAENATLDFVLVRRPATPEVTSAETSDANRLG
jgi:hypothetical protein